jgi:hypothetical protein
LSPVKNHIHKIARQVKMFTDASSMEDAEKPFYKVEKSGVI